MAGHKKTEIGINGSGKSGGLVVRGAPQMDHMEVQRYRHEKKVTVVENGNRKEISWTESECIVVGPTGKSTNKNKAAAHSNGGTKKAEADKKAEAEKKAEAKKKAEAEKKAEAKKKAEAEKKAEVKKKAEVEKKADAEAKTKKSQVHITINL